ncbi:hypothetical protein ACOSP7_031910 [Xanthoceras sorbifolium]|uniref:PGG domain-containing protein n=1 Tax=Xanthoceras sorbifolium TaxID=99658 RepID=A0ABQ8H5M0_9ROSI|nr:hypothetical protein JRO89_XS14G0177300 [Xanthoceras sorbifolium]
MHNMPMDSVNGVNEAAASDINGQTENFSRLPTVFIINPKMYKAAVDGNIQPFQEITHHPLSLFVTPIRNTILHINIASEKVSLQFVQEILGFCPLLVLQVNADGDTPLHFAVEFNRPEIVEFLIKTVKAQHEDLESGIGAARQTLRMKDNMGNTPLHKAMRNQSEDVVRMLLDEDEDFAYSANDCGESPLYIAAETGFYLGVFLMLQICSSVNHQGPDGKTTLHAAVRRWNYDLTKELLEKDKSLTKKMDENGWTPLHYAAYYGRFSTACQLLKVDTSAAYVADSCRKMTPLHLAASQGFIDIVKQIISCCPDCYKLVDDRGWNVLHFAMASLSLNPNMSISLLEDRLLEKLLHKKDDKGNTPLHVFAILDPLALSNYVNEVQGDSQAFNKRNISVVDTLNYGCPELKEEMLELWKSKGPYSRGVVRTRDKIKEEYFKKLEKAKESHLIVAALVATVTFTAAFTVPGGFKSDKGTAILSKHLAFQFFEATNALAFVFSVTAVFTYFIMSADRFQKDFYLTLFNLAPWITVFGMGAMVIAFISGSYAVLAAPSLGLAIVTCVIGLSVFILLLGVLYCVVKGL